MAATNYTPIQLYHSTTASAVPLAANLAQGELAINITDGKLYYEDSGGVVQVIATKGAGTIGGSTTQIQYNNAGALAGNAAMTFNSGTNVTTLTTLNLTNALGATYGGTAQSAYTQGDILYSSATNTLSKLGIGTVNYILTSTGSVPQWVAPSSVTVNTANNLAGGLAGSVPYQSALDTTTFLAIGAANRVMTSTGSAPQWVTSLTGLTGVSSSSITNTSLTSGRVVFSSTAGLESDSANLTFNGTTLSTTGLSNTGFSTLVKTLTLGDSSFNGAAVFAPATPAKLYMGTGTVTDVTSAISATNATGAIASLAITPIAATNTGVTYTNASTLYIAGAPSAGTNVTITNPYSLYVAAGDAFFGGTVTAGTVNLTTLDLTNLEVTNIKAKDGTASIALADTTGIATFSKATVISTTDNTNAALRITQLGTGNALLVEDEANPDSTPFVIDASGTVIVGSTAALTNGVVQTFKLDNIASNDLIRKNTAGSGIVLSGDTVGNFRFYGFDGTNYTRTAHIFSAVDGTPGANDMPGRLVFGTTADGASSPTERMRIDNAGRVGIAATPATGVSFTVGNTADTTATVYSIRDLTTVNQATTTTAIGVSSQANILTPAALTAVYRFYAAQGSFTGTVTTQYGYLSETNLTGATNNYGFYSSIAAAANRFNFYANGTADNFFAGEVGIGIVPTTKLQVYGAGTTAAFYTDGDASGSTAYLQSSGGAAGDGGQILFGSSQGVFAGIKGLLSNGTGPAGSLVFQTRTTSGNVVERMRIDGVGGVGIGVSANADVSLIVGKNITGATTAYGITESGTVISDVTTAVNVFFSNPKTVASAFTLTSLLHYAASQGTIGAGSAVTNQFGYSASATLTGATNNYGFYSNIASGTNRFNFYANGTADNYFAGNVGIGQVPVAQASLFVVKTLTGSTTGYGIYAAPTNASDVTANIVTYLSFPATANVVNQVSHYRAAQGTFTGAVTNQFGIEAQATLIGATNNYGVYSNIAAAANRWNFFANGTARNYMAADLTVNGATAIPAGGTAGAGLMVSTTANFGVFFGSGAPTLSAAKGSLYLRSDGSTVNDRMYVNTNGSTTWTSVVTSA